MTLLTGSTGPNKNAFMVMLLFLFAFAISRKQQQERERLLSRDDLNSLNDRDLELHVAGVVNALPGWTAETTSARADQGADVIATSPAGVRVAIQVKHYTLAVGNAAVQEVVASKAYYRCTHSVVFTSGPGYTRQARQLAEPNETVLWTTAELSQLQRLARERQAPPLDLLPA